MIRENGDMDISLSSILPEGIKTDLSLRTKLKYIPQKTDAAMMYGLKPLGSSPDYLIRTEKKSMRMI